MTARDAKSTAQRPVHEDLVRLRARSRTRAIVATVVMLGGLALLLVAYRTVGQHLAEDRRAGRTTSLAVLWESAPSALIGVAAGLAIAFGSMLVAALSWMHARHVEKGIESEPV